MFERSSENPVLCLIVDYSYIHDIKFESNINAAIDGGVDVVQLRDKDIPYEDFLLIGEKLKDIIDGKVLFAVNSNVMVANDLEADIIHLPEIADNVNIIKQIYKEKFIVGKSVHSTHSAKNAVSEGVDYVTIGTIFDSNSKPGGLISGLDLIELTAQEIEIPILAIGGIDASNAGSVITAGASGVTVISAITRKADQKSAALNIKSSMNSAWFS